MASTRSEGSSSPHSLARNLLGLLGAAHGDEVAGRLGDCRREDDEEEGRDDEAGEEDLPGHEAAECGLGGTARDRDDRCVDEACEEQAKDDRELAEADEAPTDICGGDLSDVAGGNRGRGTEADAADDAGQEQEGVAEAAQEGRDGPEEGLKKQEGADPHESGLAADLVGDASCGEGADQAADDTCRARNALK